VSQKTDSTVVRIVPGETYHLVGIAGAGMRTIARLLLDYDCRVTGSDLQKSKTCDNLTKLGAKIFIGHCADHINGATCVVISGAIPEHNEEVKTALENGIPVIKRAEMLEAIMKSYATRIAVTGTHGKTTTTGMLVQLLETAGQAPAFSIGSDRLNNTINAALVPGQYFVTESDESDGSFLLLSPNIGVITNIEEEHMDYFGDRENMLRHYKKFIKGVLAKDGYLVINQDNAELAELTKKEPSRQVIRFGLNEESDVAASDITFTPTGTQYQLVIKGVPSGQVRLQVYGVHNIYNSLAAICVGLKEGIAIKTIVDGILEFRGTKRRFEKIYSSDNIRIYDDYAHHPTEVRLTLDSIRRSFGNRIVCVFQPHRYTRTRQFLSQFSDAFNAADEVIITKIYAANEDHIDGPNAEQIVEALRQKEKTAYYQESLDDVVDSLLKEILRPGDLVVTMGAGDINTVAYQLADVLKRKNHVFS